MNQVFNEISGRIREAAATHTALRFRGGGSKDFYGNLLAGEVLELGAYRGIVDYDPDELCLTARTGTPLAEIETLLAENGQMLAFEPPLFGTATLGGAIACGLSGPRRQQVGPLRDFVLGALLIDGRGDALKFGGRVVKNVAGYDVSRLLAGSFGSLGWIAEASLRVLPRPAEEVTLVFSCDQAEAIVRLGRWACTPLPVSASFWADGLLRVRLSGAAAAVAAARRQLGGDLLTMSTATALWHGVREQSHPALAGEVLWRLALPPATPPLLDASGKMLPVALEWNGGLRWLGGAVVGTDLRREVAARGGHATLYRAPESLRCREGVFTPLSAPLLALHRRLKKNFDPAGILNPGRMASEF